MFRFPSCLPAYALLVVPAAAFTQQSDLQPKAAPTQLTIYNGNFAVARTTVPLDLRAGTNEVLTTDVTSQLEPDSVVLRDAAGQHAFRVVEQNYDAGVVNQQWLLQKYEGKTLQFRTREAYSSITDSGQVKSAPAEFVEGKILRAGNEPLIEVNGHLQFSLPGMPIFPTDTNGLLLKPTLRWQIESAKAQNLNAELDYITHGMRWEATYNVVMPEAKDGAGSDKADVVGWVTIQNNSGTDFPQAAVQLMAGDVAKLSGTAMYAAMDAVGSMRGGMAPAPAVTQKEFDDFHLYDLHRTVNLRNNESKQEQFLEVSSVAVARTYQYSGNNPVFSGGPGWHNIDRNYGSNGSRTVQIHEEIKNTEENHMGMPLPAGRLRLYRRETTGQMQFVGESQISHTPSGQTVSLTGGNAFDLTGERKQTDFHVDSNGHNMDESFSIKLSNAKTQPVTIHVIEHLNRAQNWQITEKSSDFTKQDAFTIDFPVTVPAKGDTTLTYSVHYTWN